MLIIQILLSSLKLTWSNSKLTTQFFPELESGFKVLAGEYNVVDKCQYCSLVLRKVRRSLQFLYQGAIAVELTLGFLKVHKISTGIYSNR